MSGDTALSLLNKRQDDSKATRLCAFEVVIDPNRDAVVRIVHGSHRHVVVEARQAWSTHGSAQLEFPDSEKRARVQGQLARRPDSLKTQRTRDAVETGTSHSYGDIRDTNQLSFFLYLFSSQGLEERSTDSASSTSPASLLGFEGEGRRRTAGETSISSVERSFSSFNFVPGRVLLFS